MDDDIILDKMIEHFSSNPMTLNQAKIKFGISIELLREKIGLKLASPIITKAGSKPKDLEDNNEKIVQPLFEGENQKE